MSVELILWLFSFASVMVLIGLTAYQASPTITPLHLLKDHTLTANPVQILRGTGQLLPSFGIRLPVVRGDLTEFDGGFGQRCCSCSAIRTFDDGDEMKSARKIIFWSLRISDNYVLLLNRKGNRCNHIYVYML